MKTNQLILSTAIIVPVSTLSARYLQRQPMPVGRIVLGSLGTAIGLSLVAMAADDVARALAWLILIGALLVNGGAIAERINSRLSPKPRRYTGRGD